MNKKILIISLIIVFLIIITTTSVLIINSTSKTKAPGPAPGPAPVPTSKPTPGPGPAPTPGPGPAPTPGPVPTSKPTPGPGPAPNPTPGPVTNPTPVPGKSQTFNIQNHWFGVDDPKRSHLIFTKSGTIESITSNLSLSTNTATYGFGTILAYIIATRSKGLIQAGEVKFPPNPYSGINTQIALGEYISVQQGDVLFIGAIETFGQVSGTITVNFI